MTFARLASLASLALASTLIAAPAAAESGAVSGSGSTFVAPLMRKWIEAYGKAHSEQKIGYDASGSGAGIKDILERRVAFAASDAPLTDAQMKDAPDVIQLPVIAGPEVLIYNGTEMPASIVLDGATVAAIFLGSIDRWNDPRIARLNPEVALPAKDIVTVHRADGSGTTWIFSNYLDKVSRDWSTRVGFGPTIRWPNGIGARGNQGVAEAVSVAEGSIGYVELAFAVEHKLSFAKLVNREGKVVEASLDGVREAVRSTTGGIPDDLRLSVTDAPGAGSYPICGFSYFLMHQDLSYLKDPAVASQVAQFIEWCEHDGQQLASPNYIPLTEELQERVERKLRTIVCDGRPAIAAK